MFHQVLSECHSLQKARDSHSQNFKKWKHVSSKRVTGKWALVSDDLFRYAQLAVASFTLKNSMNSVKEKLNPETEAEICAFQYATTWMRMWFLWNTICGEHSSPWVLEEVLCYKGDLYIGLLYFWSVHPSVRHVTFTLLPFQKSKPLMWTSASGFAPCAVIEVCSWGASYHRLWF